MTSLKRGDHVCYSAAFLKATGLTASDEAHMRGTVQVIRLGAHERTIVVVQFGGGTFREVNASNLSHINSNQWITI